MNQKKYQARVRQESGTVLVLVMVFIVALIAFASLSIDLANVYHQQRNVQSGTDAAALAAVVYLTNSPPLTAKAIQEALDIAAANGVTAAEIAASSNGVVQAGNWNPGTQVFTPNTAPYNAVSVPAKRTVPMMFGKIIGMNNMSPAVDSIAVTTNAGSAYGGNGYGLIPFAVHPAQATNAFYVQYSFTKGDIGSGNFGKLDFSSIDGSLDWAAAMDGGCNCSVTLGDFYSDIPGNAGISEAFSARLADDPYITLAVFGPDGSGNSGHGEVITGFVNARIVSVTGNGNWTVTLENVPGFISGGGGTNVSSTSSYVRNLVR